MQGSKLNISRRAASCDRAQRRQISGFPCGPSGGSKCIHTIQLNMLPFPCAIQEVDKIVFDKKILKY